MNTNTTQPGLLAYGRNITSEHGEDGIIERIFSVIGKGSPPSEGSRWCVELGALNGTHGSNVWRLITETKWSAVAIEADQTYFEKLQEVYRGFAVDCVNAFVSFEGENSLDQILSRTPIPHNFDLLSLDIDGNDYHVWESMLVYRPRVVVVEYNPSIPDDVLFIQPRDMRVQQGSSLRALVELGKSKGYELVATTQSNALFVSKELFPLFGISDNSLEALHLDHTLETKLFQLYDGTLLLAGNERLIWHNIPIDIEALQVLSRRKRFYPARTSARASVRSLKHRVRTWPVYPLLIRLRHLLWR